MSQKYTTVDDAAAAAIFRAIARNYREESGVSVLRNSDGTYSINNPANAIAGTPEAIRGAQFDVPNNAAATAHNHPYYQNIWEGFSQADIVDANQRRLPSYVGVQSATSTTPSSAELRRYTPGETSGERVGTQILSKGDEVLAQFPIDEWQRYWDGQLGTNDAAKIAADRDNVRQAMLGEPVSSAPSRPVEAAPLVESTGPDQNLTVSSGTANTNSTKKAPYVPLEERSHSELYNLRRQPGADQNMLAPFEHRAFAREWATEHPLLAGLSIPAATIGYTVSKALGREQSRSDASIDQIFAGLQGLGEGWRRWWHSRNDPINENQQLTRMIARKQRR